MKSLSLLSLLMILTIACQNGVENNDYQAPDLSKYPEAIQKSLEAHGGLELWQQMKALTFEIVDSAKGNEMHYIDLQNRRDKVEGANFKMGYDGTDIWVKADTSYKGNAAFYHNLIFYFYAMPFVLADDGIIYEAVDALEYEGKSYPGIKISYEDGVGTSSKDEYILYYDSETYQMAWLGYTVTYFSQEKSDSFRIIRYNDWRKIGKLLLPNSMTWYNYKDGEVINPRKTMTFGEVIVSDVPHEEYVFEKPTDAKIVE